MGLSEKGLPVPVVGGVTTQPLPRWRRYALGVVLSLMAVLLLRDAVTIAYRPPSGQSPDVDGLATAATAEQCAQVAPLFPVKHDKLADELWSVYEAKGFRAEVADALGGAVRVETAVYDTYGNVGEDPQWEKFLKFHDYLEAAFPEVHATLNLTKVNSYALVYSWAGSDPSLKPLMLTAHQDVVPIEPETLSQWIHPPFSGYYDGEWIWGRGAGDQKSGVIGIMIALETLLKHGFHPARGLIVAFGFDEEASGRQGAEAISRYLLTTYGVNSVGLLVDEGGGLVEEGGTLFAGPCVGEKGYIDVRMEVTTPGGHSSVPPEHTGIGHLSALITTLESHPLPYSLSRTNPYYAALQCRASYASLPGSLADDIKDSLTNDTALKRVGDAVGSTRQGKAMLGTTQAVDLVNGGVKVNALPEKVYAVVNHRISVDSSVKDVKNRFITLLHPYALSQNLSLTAFGLNFTFPGPGPAAGTITLTDAYGTALEPAPVSPHGQKEGGEGEGAWEVLAGTIRGLWEGVVVAPSVIGGNTDTRYYWHLTRAIYRYGGMNAKDSYNGAHTVNEAVRAKGLVDRIKFFTAIILNSDEAEF